MRNVDIYINYGYTRTCRLCGGKIVRGHRVATDGQYDFCDTNCEYTYSLVQNWLRGRETAPMKRGAKIP